MHDKKLQPGDFIQAEAVSVDYRVWSETGCTMRPTDVHKRRNPEAYDLSCPIDALGLIGAFAGVQLSQWDSE